MLGNEEAMFISGRVSVVFHPEEGGPRFFTHDLRKNEPNREIPFEAFQLFPRDTKPRSMNRSREDREREREQNIRAAFAV